MTVAAAVVCGLIVGAVFYGGLAVGWWLRGGESRIVTVDPAALRDAIRQAGTLKIMNRIELANAVLLAESDTERTLH